MQSGALDQLDEKGFADCLISLRQHIAVTTQPKRFRASMIELEAILNENLDIMTLESLSDILFTFVMTDSNHDSLKTRVLILLQD